MPSTPDSREATYTSPPLNSSEWWGAAEASLPRSPCTVPCPRPARHHAPRSPRVPRKPPGASRGPVAPAPTPPQPPGSGPLGTPPSGRGVRSPAARFAVARRRGRAAGRGQRTARGAGLANLRRRSPRYVYLGRLTPALPAGSGRALARAPVGPPGGGGGLVRGAGAGASHAGCSCEARGGSEDAAGPGAHGSGWGGGGAACPCSPGPALAPPPPGGAPAAATHRPAGPKGRAREI